MEFKQAHQALERQQKALVAQQEPMEERLDLERAAQLLRGLPALWAHPGVEEGQRRDLVREVFEEVRLRGHQITAVRPREQYQPLFAYSVLRGEKFMGLVGVSGFEPPAPCTPCKCASGLRHTPAEATVAQALSGRNFGTRPPPPCRWYTGDVALGVASGLPGVLNEESGDTGSGVPWKS